uniref:Uncharacterized protein n=1 Tax=Leersia perrieri TaxID=77586 RepID=A0A0D9WIQ3_9ORYZ
MGFLSSLLNAPPTASDNAPPCPNRGADLGSPFPAALGFRGSEGERERERAMALTNFILTVVGVGTAVLLLRRDVKQSASTFRRNVRHIRNWLEEESSSASRSAERVAPKELESQAAKKDVTPKDDKH